MSAEEIKAALEVATPGPWAIASTQLRRDSVAHLENKLAGDDLWLYSPVGRPMSNTRTDAHLIANAPTWLAELLARAEAAEARVAELESEVDDKSEVGHMVADAWQATAERHECRVAELESALRELRSVIFRVTEMSPESADHQLDEIRAFARAALHPSAPEGAPRDSA